MVLLLFFSLLQNKLHLKARTCNKYTNWKKMSLINSHFKQFPYLLSGSSGKWGNMTGTVDTEPRPSFVVPPTSSPSLLFKFIWPLNSLCHLLRGVACRTFWKFENLNLQLGGRMSQSPEVQTDFTPMSKLPYFPLYSIFAGREPSGLFFHMASLGNVRSARLDFINQHFH